MRITSTLGSQRQLAKRFRVSLTFIENLLKRYRTDGTVEPRAHGGGQVAKLSPEQETVLASLVEEDNDAILVELCNSDLAPFSTRGLPNAPKPGRKGVEVIWFDGYGNHL